MDFKKLGYDVIAFIGIYLKESSMYDAVAKELGKMPRDRTIKLYNRQLQHVCRSCMPGYQAN